MAQPDDLTGYLEHRTGVQIDRLLSAGRVIPSRRIKAEIERNFPGWTWGELYPIFRSAGVVDASFTFDQHVRCDPSVRAIHFDKDGSWAVEWLAGGVVERTYSSERSRGESAFSVGTGTVDE